MLMCHQCCPESWASHLRPSARAGIVSCQTAAARCSSTVLLRASVAWLPCRKWCTPPATACENTSETEWTLTCPFDMSQRHDRLIVGLSALPPDGHLGAHGFHLPQPPPGQVYGVAAEIPDTRAPMCGASYRRHPCPCAYVSHWVRTWATSPSVPSLIIRSAS